MLYIHYDINCLLFSVVCKLLSTGLHCTHYVPLDLANEAVYVRTLHVLVVVRGEVVITVIDIPVNVHHPSVVPEGGSVLERHVGSSLKEVNV